MKIEVEQQVLQAVVDYLKQQPYQEVCVLISKLMQSPKAGKEPKKKEPKKKEPKKKD